jgi:transposase-like protein
MKGKQYTTEDKIRILREADRGLKSIQAICQENNIGSELPPVEASVRADGCQRGPTVERAGAREP